MRVLFFANWRLERDRLLRDLNDLAHLIGLDLHTPADLVARGLPAVLLDEPPAYADELVNRFDHMHRNADGASLVGYCARDRLANPPGGICAELEALAVIELFDGANEAYISFLDEVQERHTAPYILLRYADDKPQVRFSQTLFRAEAFVFQALEVHARFLLVGEQPVAEVLRRRRQPPVSPYRLRGPRDHFRSKYVRDDVHTHLEAFRFRFLKLESRRQLLCLLDVYFTVEHLAEILFRNSPSMLDIAHAY